MMLQQAASVLSCLLFFLVTTDAIQLQQSIPICCNNGTHHANRERSCEAIDSKPIPDIGSKDEEDVKHCRIMMRSCCVQELQRGMCIKGLDHRSTNGSCDRVRPDGCASVEKTCCECCELGMRAFWESAVASCEGTDLGTECDFAFRECCQRASSSNDVDQCSIAKDNNHRLCSMKCVNLINSYVCECPEGYVLASTDDMTCIRETGVPNPCDRSYCEQRCVPDGSSYLCACNEGFFLQDDGYSCRGDGPSSSLACMFANCEHGCRPIGPSSYECFCEQGYDLDEDRATCIDANECQEIADICPLGEICYNTVGSFSCHPEPDCSTGLRYNADSSRCEDIDECQQEKVCPLHKLCQNYQGGFYCQTTRCVEGEHYDENSRGCRDVDECALGLHDCGDGFRCDNLAGSYRCTRTSPCGTGYTVDAMTQRCNDIDECFQDTDECPPTFYCQNTLGSFKCKPCRQGFRADNSDGCTLDINECEELSDICPLGQTCINSYGSYRCNPACPEGFQYNDIFHACRDVNECTQGVDNCRANQVCQNTEGSYECGCQDGMELNHVTRECIDIDECQSGTHNCRYNEQCFNFQGSFACQQRCQLNYKYNATFGCVDINECEQPHYPCLGNSQCVNLPGSFRCQQCPRGQIANRDARRCEDVDECKYEGARCMGGCRNTFGSYMCTCPNGYELVNRYNCRDIDECRRNIHNCSSQSACFNTRGRFKCKNIQCPQYFRKEINTNKCVRLRCSILDADCLNLPLSMSFNYIAFSSHFLAPAVLFKIATVPDRRFSYRFKFLDGHQGGEFALLQSTYVATIQVMRSIEGPKDYNLDVEMEVYHRGVLAARYVSKIFFNVSEHPF